MFIPILQYDFIYSSSNEPFYRCFSPYVVMQNHTVCIFYCYDFSQKNIPEHVKPFFKNVIKKHTKSRNIMFINSPVYFPLLILLFLLVMPLLYCYTHLLLAENTSGSL